LSLEKKKRPSFRVRPRSNRFEAISSSPFLRELEPTLLLEKGRFLPRGESFVKSFINNRPPGLSSSAFRFSDRFFRPGLEKTFVSIEL
jgi:hypothetical protein